MEQRPKTQGRRTFPAPGTGPLRGGLMLLLAVLAAVAAMAQTTPPIVVADNTKVIQRQLKLLRSSMDRLETRKDAAATLLDLQDPASKEPALDPAAKGPLLKILQDPTDKQARLAVIEALAERDGSIPDFTEPLMQVLLACDPDLQPAVLSALSLYRTPKLTEQLLSLAQDSKRTIPQRLAAVHALGRMLPEAAAGPLFRMMEAATAAQGERCELAVACANSLRELTHMDLGTNLAAWKAWWAKNGGKSAYQWLETKLDLVTNENRDLKKRLQQTEDAYIDSTIRLFRLGSPNEADRTKAIQDYLGGVIPAQRRAGIELLATYLAAKQPIPPALRPAMRDLIDDPDPDVRRTAARVIGESGDLQAVKPLLEQSKVETDPMVNQAILVAIGQLGGDKSLLDQLLEKMNSQVDAVSIGAAKAIAKIFQNQAQIKRSQRDHVVRALIKRYEMAAPDQTELKQELLLTMGLIPEYPFRAVFERELASNVANLRLYAVRGLGALKDVTLVNVLAKQLNDSEPGVRAEIATQIAKLTHDADAVEVLLTRVNPNNEKDNQVREATWMAILSMIKSWSVDQQLQWANNLTLQADPINDEQKTALADSLETRIMDEAASWPTDQKVAIMTSFARFLLKTPRAENSVKFFLQAVTAAPEKSEERAQQVLTDLFRWSVRNDIIAKYLNNLVGHMEQHQLEAVVSAFAQRAEHQAMVRSVGQICRLLSPELLNSVSAPLRARLGDLARKYSPRTHPATHSVPATAGAP